MFCIFSPATTGSRDEKQAQPDKMYAHNLLCFLLWYTIETVCPNKIPIDSRDEKGFDILFHLKLAKKSKKTQGSFYGMKAYQVTSRDDLTENTRYSAVVFMLNLHSGLCCF